MIMHKFSKDLRFQIPPWFVFVFTTNSSPHTNLMLAVNNVGSGVREEGHDDAPISILMWSAPHRHKASFYKYFSLIHLIFLKVSANPNVNYKKRVYRLFEILYQYLQVDEEFHEY